MAGAGNVMFRAQFADLFVSRLAYIDEILYEQYDAPNLTYTEIFNVRDSQRAYEEMTEITGFGTFSPKSEGGIIDYDKLMEGFSTRFTHDTYAKGVQISMEAAADDLDGAITNVMPPLGRSAHVSIENTAWNMVNNGFASAGSPTLTPDGKSLFNAAHIMRGGGTYSNYINGDLSIATLETGINLFDDMVDDRGLPIELGATKLVFPTNLRWLAYEIMKSDMRSDTANNVTNAFNQLSLTPVMSKYLTGSTDWALFSDPNVHRVIVYWRMEPQVDHTIDFDTGNLKSKMTYRISTGAAGWRGCVGGEGA